MELTDKAIRAWEECEGGMCECIDCMATNSATSWYAWGSVDDEEMQCIYTIENGEIYEQWCIVEGPE